MLDRRASGPDPSPPARPGNNTIGVSAPIVTGFLVQATGNFNLAFIVAGAMLVIVSSATWWRSVPSSRSPPPPNKKRRGSSKRN